MTTSVSIINNGPDKVRVAAVNDHGQVGVGTVTLAPSERHDMYVYPGQDVQVREVRESSQPVEQQTSGVDPVQQEPKAEGAGDGGGEAQTTTQT